jgi:hypothetical protein
MTVDIRFGFFAEQDYPLLKQLQNAFRKVSKLSHPVVEVFGGRACSGVVSFTSFNQFAHRFDDEFKLRGFL